MKSTLLKITAIGLASLFLSAPAFALGTKDKEVRKTNGDASSMSDRGVSIDRDTGKDQDKSKSMEKLDDNSTNDLNFFPTYP